MATPNNSDDDEQFDMDLMVDAETDSNSRSDSINEEIEVIYDLFRSELIQVINEFLNKIIILF